MKPKLLLALFLAVCMLSFTCNCRSAPISSKIVGSWYFKDFPGLTCEFKGDGTYHAKAVTKDGATISADGTYSLAGSSFTGGTPSIRGDSNDQLAQLLILRTMTTGAPAKGTIAWISDDEFTVTHHNPMRGADETVSWKRQK
jgi:hypothetical protein